MPAATTLAQRLERFLERWGGVIARHRARVLWGAALLGLLSLPGAYHTLRHLDANVLDQVSQKLPRFKDLREVGEDFGGDMLVCVAALADERAGDPAARAELKRLGGLLARELAQVGAHPEDRGAWPEADVLEGEPWLRYVECRAGESMRKALEQLARERLQALLTLEDVKELAAKFEPEALAARMQALRAELAGLDPALDLERRRLMADPLKLAGLAREALDKRLLGRQSGVDPEGYYLSGDGGTLLVLARPVRGASDLEFVRALMAACQRAENRALEAFRAEREASGAPALSTSLKGEVFAVPAAGEPEEPELRVGFTGLHAVTAENELSLRLDILNTTAGSAIAVLLLFLAVFRELRLALCIAATMGLSVAVTLALTALLHGKIGVMGAGFTCILLGMGVDYGIHLYSTFHHLCEENRYSAEEALRQTLARCGPGVLAACLTTLVAFLGIATTHFKMLAELGLLAGIGLGVCGVLMLTLFPALLYRGEGKKKGGHVARSIRGTTILLGKMHQRRRRGWLGVSLGLLGLLVAGGLLLGGPDPGADPVLGVRFDGELSNLRSLRIKAIPLRMEVTKRFGKAFADVKVVAEGPGEETAFAAAEAAQARLRPYFERGELLPSGGLLDYLPSARRQHETLAALRALDLPACKARFFEAARAEFGARAGASFKPFGDRLDEMQAGLADARPLTLEEVLAGPLAPVVGFFARIDGEGESRRVRILNNYLPASLAYGKAWFTELASEVEAGAPPHSSLRLVAARLVGFELKDSLLLDMEWISGAVTACVLVLLVCTFWSFKKAALAAVPLVFGILFVLAGVVVAQMCHKEFALNYVNLMIFPVLLGSAIDYGVYLVYDVYSSRRPALNEILTETGRGVLLCGLTTLAGFGSMVLGSYTGLIGFGYAAILGYVGALFGALIVLPGLLGLLGLGRERPESLKQPAER